MEYRVAREVERIVRDLIADHYAHLHGIRISCVFLSKTPKSKGRDVWARAKKISGLPAFLSDENGMSAEYDEMPPDFFVIEVSEEIWTNLTESQRRALVDEQLVRLEIVEDDEGRVNLAVVDRGVVLVPEIVERHGLWRDSIEEAVRAGAEQLELEGVS